MTDESLHPVLLSGPDVGDAEARSFLDALRSGWIAPLGPQVDAFEVSLAQRCGRAHAVALSSGTAALHLALLDAGAAPGTVVVVPTMTFVATANAVLYTGATPVFVDADPVTGNLDPDLLAAALQTLTEEKTRVSAVVTVDLLGRCADHRSITAVCATHRVPVIEDAAEALGSSDRGDPAGGFGASSVLSFNGNKVMTTSGGGALLTDDATAAERARFLSTQAREPARHYEHAERGYNYRLSNLLAAVGLAQLERLDGMVSRRRGIRERYAAMVADLEGVEIFQRTGDGQDNCWLTALLVDERAAGWRPGDLGRAMEAALVETRPLWKPMHLQPLFHGARAFLSGAAERLFGAGVALPSGSALTPHDLDRVESTFRDFVRSGP